MHNVHILIIDIYKYIETIRHSFCTSFSYIYIIILDRGQEISIKQTHLISSIMPMHVDGQVPNSGTVGTIDRQQAESTSHHRGLPCQGYMVLRIKIINTALATKFILLYKPTHCDRIKILHALFHNQLCQFDNTDRSTGEYYATRYAAAPIHAQPC